MCALIAETIDGMDLKLDISQEGCRAIGAFVDAFDRPGAFDEALANASGHRRRKVASMRLEGDRRLSLLAGVLLDELLRERGLRERDMAYVESENGKPSFAQHPDLHFSLAHSGQMAVAALAQVPVGIDVERLPEFPYDIAEPRLWTEMEAVGKLLGCGVGVFVDGGAYRRPGGICVRHASAGDYLVCLAQRVQWEQQAD